MKTLLFGILMVFLSSLSWETQAQASAVTGGDTTLSLKIRGNCRQCKSRIESAYQKAGLKNVNWSAETETATLRFPKGAFNRPQLEQIALQAGHDTETDLASDDSYDRLAACCQYRDPQTKKGHHAKPRK